MSTKSKTIKFGVQRTYLDCQCIVCTDVEDHESYCEIRGAPKVQWLCTCKLELYAMVNDTEVTCQCGETWKLEWVGI